MTKEAEQGIVRKEEGWSTKQSRDKSYRDGNKSGQSVIKVS